MGNHGPDRRRTGALETLANQSQQIPTDAVFAVRGRHVNGKHPPAGRCAELPRPDLANDETADTAIMLGDEKKPGIPGRRHKSIEYIAPICSLAHAGLSHIEVDDLIEVGQMRVADLN